MRVAQDVAAVVQREIDALQAAGVNKIIVVSHLQGVAGDLALAAALRGVDVLIAGGGDELLANAGNLLLPGDDDEIFGPYPLLVPDADGRNVPVGVAPGRYTYVGRLIVEFDASGVVTAIDPASGPMRVVGGDYPDAMEPHAAVQEQAVAPVADFIGALARTPVGTTEVPLDGQRRVPCARRRPIRAISLPTRCSGKPTYWPTATASRRRTWRCKTVGAFATTP